MATITLKGCGQYDGAFDLNMGEPFNTGDLNIIKQISGVRAQELEEAFAAGDTDLIVALAVIALCRAGKATRRSAVQAAESIWAAPDGGLKFDMTAEEAEARPPEPSASAAANA